MWKCPLTHPKQNLRKRHLLNKKTKKIQESQRQSCNPKAKIRVLQGIHVR